MKNIFSKLLTVVLALALFVGVVAAEETACPTNANGSLTINGVVANKTYGLFRIFDATLSGSGDTAKVSYTINSRWAAFFAEGGAGASYIVDENNQDKTYSSIVVNGQQKFIALTESNVVAFANAAQAYIATLTNDTPDYQATAGEEDESVTVTCLVYGYYLVFPYSASEPSTEGGSMVSLTTTTPTAEINMKAKYPDIKKVADDISVEVGQTVTYTITVKVPDTKGSKTYTYRVEDTMTEGLTFDGLNSIHVYKNSVDADNEVTSNVTKTLVDNGFTAELNILNGVKNNLFAVGDDLLVVYTATVNEHAINVVEVNKAKLVYGHKPNGEPESTPEVETENYSTKILVIKEDGNNKDVKLAGAKFVLTNADGAYYKSTVVNNIVTDVEWITAKDAEAAIADGATVGITDTNGETDVFKGLEDGTYYLVETEAPDGYNMLTEPVEVEVKNTTETVVTTTANVENFSGAVLPSTGGIGTTLFVTFGSIIALGAALVFVTNKRMAKEFN